MGVMLRGLIFTTFALAFAQSLADQAQRIVRIKVAISADEQKTVPLPRHALLISDNPPSAAPRRILTGLDGTVEIALPPGNYTVESDRPVTLNGKAYVWTVMVDVAVGRAASLELTQDNAE